MLKSLRFTSNIHQQTFYKDQIVHCEIIPSRPARYESPDKPLSSIIQKILESHRLYPLFSHQSQALNILHTGRNILVATSAASGKSMCFNLPVMQSILDDIQSCSLYLFPTKALAQDQLNKIRHLFSPTIIGPDEFDTYDGDTPNNIRPSIRKKARIILSNPDMLHTSILPNHSNWARFLRNLQFVVIDEAHFYRGVLGSHVALIIRRLRRLCKVYGANPQFVLCSATINNPSKHASNLTGLEFEVINNDGSPKGEKEFVFWNPPLEDTKKCMRRSANTESSLVTSLLVSNKIRTICFARTRRLSELIAKLIRERLSKTNKPFVSRVKTYRAGYMAEDRRKLERELACGALLAVVTTNALELGIDIGDLDATIMVGYPGTVSSTWQQSGRSGRREELSLSVLIGLDNPLDQYIMRHPEYFFSHSYENALLNWKNEHVLRSHLLCAAWEKPLFAAELEFFGETALDEISQLVEKGVMKKRHALYCLSPALSQPVKEVSIRSASKDKFLLIDARNGKLIETLDTSHAFMQAHLGAIYLHQGESLHVKEFDLLGKVIYAEPRETTYYTEASDITDVRIVKALKSKQVGAFKVTLGKVGVNISIPSYKKKAHLSESIIGVESLDLPSLRYNTISLWFDLPTTPNTLDLLPFLGGLHAIEHASIGMLPLFAMCDRNDIGGISINCHPDTGKPQIFIYDAHPGGVGIAEKGYELIHELWKTTYSTIAECPCQDGCPSCIQSPKCGNNNIPLDKKSAQEIMKKLLQGEKSA